MKKGFTLMEILIVIALIMLVFLILLSNIRNQIMKAQDAQRKTDLNKIQKSLEEYYNDNETYPGDSSYLSTCGATDLAPYLPKILCDPVSKTPYLYVLGQTTASDGYVICAKLANLSDPDIIRIGCDPVKGCGWRLGYNYCLSSGNLAINPKGIAGDGNGPLGTPTPTSVAGDWACAPGNWHLAGDSSTCKNYGHDNAISKGCLITYMDTYCDNQCDTSHDNWCAQP